MILASAVSRARIYSSTGDTSGLLFSRLWLVYRYPPVVLITCVVLSLHSFPFLPHGLEAYRVPYPVYSNHSIASTASAASRPCRNGISFLPYPKRKAQKLIDQLNFFPFHFILHKQTYDLEDAVTAAEKPAARRIIKDALNMPRPGGVREVCVRINAVESGLALEDLRVVLQGKNLDTIVVPKVESAGDLTFVSNVLDHSNHPNKSSIRILALLESARSIIDIRQITGSTPRLSGLIFAAEDFAKDLSIIRTPSLTEFLLARQTIAMAARAYSIPSAIDLVCTSYRDVATLERECLDGVGMGFNGKQVVHPSQVDVVQRLFLPGEEQVRAAVKVLVAEKVAEAEGRGAWGLDGRMVDRPVIEAARGIVGKMEAVGVDISGVWEAEKETKPE